MQKTETKKQTAAAAAPAVPAPAAPVVTGISAAVLDKGGDKAKPSGASGPVAAAASAEAAAALARQTAQMAHITEIGKQIVVMTVATGAKYLELCSYIRAEQVDKKQVADALKPLGFHKVRQNFYTLVHIAIAFVFSGKIGTKAHHSPTIVCNPRVQLDGQISYDFATIED